MKIPDSLTNNSLANQSLANIFERLLMTRWHNVDRVSIIPDGRHCIRSLFYFTKYIPNHFLLSPLAVLLPLTVNYNTK